MTTHSPKRAGTHATQRTCTTHTHAHAPPPNLCSPPRNLPPQVQAITEAKFRKYLARRDHTGRIVWDHAAQQLKLQIKPRGRINRDVPMVEDLKQLSGRVAWGAGGGGCVSGLGCCCYRMYRNVKCATSPFLCSCVCVGGGAPHELMGLGWRGVGWVGAAGGGEGHEG